MAARKQREKEREKERRGRGGKGRKGEGEGRECVSSLILFSPFFFPFSLLDGAPHIQGGSSPFINPLWKPLRHTQRCALLIFQALLNPIKLTFKINHHSTHGFHTDCKERKAAELSLQGNVTHTGQTDTVSSWCGAIRSTSPLKYF
jgi:hypothetical protein